jgi:hypothetical protein
MDQADGTLFRLGGPLTDDHALRRSKPLFRVRPRTGYTPQDLAVVGIDGLEVTLANEEDAPRAGDHSRRQLAPDPPAPSGGLAVQGNEEALIPEASHPFKFAGTGFLGRLVPAEQENTVLAGKNLLQCEPGLPAPPQATQRLAARLSQVQSSHVDVAMVGGNPGTFRGKEILGQRRLPEQPELGNGWFRGGEKRRELFAGAILGEVNR